MNVQKFRHFYLNKYVVSPASRRKYHLCYNYKYKALWYRVAKVASRTIDQHFRDHTPAEEYIYSSEVGYWPGQFQDWFKFAFVRNPIDRFLSAWRNKVVEENYFHFSDQVHREMQDIGKFIAWVEPQDIEACDEHLRVQASLIDLNHVDFVGRLENLGEDLMFVASQIDLPIGEIHKKNTTKKRSTSLSNAQEEKLREIYLKDFSIFYPEA